jgi:hypothetical protein
MAQLHPSGPSLLVASAISATLFAFASSACSRQSMAVGPDARSAGATDSGTATDAGGLATDAGPEDARPTTNDAAMPLVEPCNGLDDNADGRVDESCPCADGEEQACFVGTPALAGVGACARGVQSCELDREFGTWGACTGSGSPTDETCGNEIDDDCDGVADEGCIPSDCAPGDIPEPEVCGNGVDEDCDGLIDEFCESGRAVGRAVRFGAGRLVVWGDEHVFFDSYGDPPRAFWRQMLGWLANGDTRVVTNRALPDAVIADARADGLTITSSFDSGFDARADVLVLVGSTEVDPVALADWVWAGGGLMVLSVGFGDSFECDGLNNPLFELPIQFNCDDPAPWGPVDRLFPHPTTTGLPLDAAPFVNGRWVVEQPDVGSTVLATVAP